MHGMAECIFKTQPDPRTSRDCENISQSKSQRLSDPLSPPRPHDATPLLRFVGILSCSVFPTNASPTLPTSPAPRIVAAHAPATRLDQEYLWPAPRYFQVDRRGAPSVIIFIEKATCAETRRVCGFAQPLQLWCCASTSCSSAVVPMPLYDGRVYSSW